LYVEPIPINILYKNIDKYALFVDIFLYFYFANICSIGIISLDLIEFFK